MLDNQQPSRTLRTLFGAFVFVLGFQSIRFMFGSLTWYLRDTVGIGVVDLIPLALAPFVLAAALPVLSRWLTVRGGLWVGTWLLVLSRIYGQIADSPAIDFWMSAAGTLALVGLVPLMLSMGRSTLVGGLLLGLAIDSAIRGMGLSLDLAYQSGMSAFVGVLAISTAALYTLWACPPIDRKGVGFRDGLPLLGIAPFLFVELLIFQNQGWTSEVAGIGAPQAQLRIALLNVVALIAVAFLERNRGILILSVAVVVAAVIAAEGGELLFNVLSLLAVPAAGLVWASMVPDPEDHRVAGSATYLVGGMTLFVILGLAYYVPMDLDLGFGQSQVRIAAALGLAVFGMLGAVSLPAHRPGVAQRAWAFAALASILPLLGFVVAARSAESVDPGVGPVRFMTYNIHSSYDPTGRFDIEAIASVIEDSGADVVGLQEIPRGRLISGVSDQLALLQERLGFEHSAFFGTTDPTWGNAVLSRYPITSVQKEYLPLVGTPLRRGYLGVDLRIGDRNLLFISTHLQHVNDKDLHDQDPEADLYPVHHEQIATILRQWDDEQPAVMVGDFNARPGWRQVEEILAAGWIDSWAEAGVGDGFTANAVDPKHRIDYIFHTPDLSVTDVGVLLSQASDHFPVVADIG